MINLLSEWYEFWTSFYLMPFFKPGPSLNPIPVRATMEPESVTRWGCPHRSRLPQYHRRSS